MKIHDFSHMKRGFCLVFLAVFLSACLQVPANSLSDTIPSITSTAAPSLNVTPVVVTITPTRSITSTSTALPPSEPTGCLLPPDDYTIITVNDHQLNQRTYDMLAYAKTLYSGPIDITGSAITQGSYTTAVEASFGTHAGGGAVDLSVMAPGTYTILNEEIASLIHALRLAGFAAWYRDFNALYEGSSPHIHAIAIGDRELSLAAREQLAGPFGYFWGYDGLPQEDGVAQRDPHGGPVICDWMMDMGYPSKTATPSP